MSVLRWLDRYFEISIGVALMSSMTIILAIQVFMRYVMGASLYWSEELARYIFIWLIYLGISYSARQMTHIKVDAALGLFPLKLRPWVVFLGDMLFLGFALFIVWTSWTVVQRQMMLGQTSTAMQIPMWFVYSAPLVGFALTAIRQVQTLIWRARNPDKYISEEV
ncbi:TRAP transporter small permease [Frigidibacter sp. MR17.24]|uniref:TRAP transporter small permease n=1 Tax=Frigidibacter sp. MR17.24 TaxID=3127345 RepID=UPI0030130F2A